MKDQDLDHKIKEYYGKQSLPDSAVQRILELGNAEAAKVDAKGGRSWLKWMPLAVAAALALFISVEFSGFNRGYSPYAEELAGAIAMRHNMKRNFGVEAGNFEEVQGGLKDLIFSVQPSIKQKLLSTYELLGARLCQLEGQQAAHMQVRNRKTGALCTLYVATLEGPLRSLEDKDTGLDLEANHVDMWIDSGRLFALVD